jgi:HSP20 family molecular chaperone IbpA
MFPWNLFPFNKDMQSKLKQMNPNEINQYVQNMMDKMFSSSFPHKMNGQEMMKDFDLFHNAYQQPSTTENTQNLKYSIFETHENIFVRIEIETEEWLKELRLYHTSTQLIIEHIPSIGDKNTIPLPSLVKKKGTTAHFKEGILEVRIVKNIDMQFSEVDITEIL